MKPGGLLPVGRVAGRRGTDGELTVRVAAGDAAWWQEIEEVRIGADAGAAGPFSVERARAYRDRLVLKLEGVDDAGAAEALRGRQVWVSRELAPEQPEGRYYAAALVGLRVIDEVRGEIGRVIDVAPAGGAADLLVVERAAGEDVLVPLADEIVLAVDEAGGRIDVRLPEGLLEL